MKLLLPYDYTSIYHNYHYIIIVTMSITIILIIILTASRSDGGDVHIDCKAKINEQYLFIQNKVSRSQPS